MAIFSKFFVDAADLATATSVYLDAPLTHISPDGFYGDGTIIRQQSGGILLAAVSYLPCTATCDNTIYALGNQGIYTIEVNVGTDTGAIIISFDPENIPDGILAEYDSLVYNKLSSPVDGLHQSATPGNYTIVGLSSAAGSCSSSWYPAGGTVYLEPYYYAAPDFFPTGAPAIPVVVDASDISLSASAPGMCVMVIPKPISTPEVVTLSIIGPCDSTGWNINVSCPALLPMFNISDQFSMPSHPCGKEIGQTAYFAKVHTALDSYIGLYDYVFVNNTGEDKLPDGFYLTDNVASPDKVIEVVNGIVIAIINCT
jgi:hypothetical protein